jgi:hypothetical protein
MLIQPGVTQEDPLLIVIYPCQERCPGGDGFAFEVKRTELAFDGDIIAHVHAARPAHPAVEGHGSAITSLLQEYEMEGHGTGAESVMTGFPAPEAGFNLLESDVSGKSAGRS